MSPTAAEYNAKVIDELRGIEGRVGGVLEGTPLLVTQGTTRTAGPLPSISAMHLASVTAAG